MDMFLPLTSAASNCNIFNNIFYNIDGENSSSHKVINNVFVAATSKFNESVIQNNIFNANGTGGSNTFVDCLVQNNLSAGPLPAGDGNQSSIDMNTVFVGSGSSDGQWQLAPGSPAIGAGYYGGEDCGAFDVPPGFGWTPYRLSGVPSIPSIYQFSTTLVGDTLQVNISARSNN